LLLRHDTRFETATRSSRMSAYCFCFTVQGTAASTEYTEFTLTTWRTYASIDLVQMLRSNPGLKPGLQVRFGSSQATQPMESGLRRAFGRSPEFRTIDWLIASFTYYSCALRLRNTTNERYRVQSGLMGIWQIAWIGYTKHRQQNFFLYDRRMLYGNLEAFILKRKKKIQFVEIFLSRRNEESGAVS